MASFNGGSSKEPLTLEHLIALNDEITSLVQAGVPLELGLKQFSDDQTDALGEIGKRLSERLSRGQSLSEALSAEGDRFPRVYRVVVEAGLRAGRLPAALEALSGFGWELVDLRRRIGLALLYPAIVFLLAYGLFLVLLLEVAARFYSTYEMFRLPLHGVLQALMAIRETAVYWAWIPPVCVLLLFSWWMLTGGPQLLNFTGLNRPLGWIPGMKRIGFSYRCANFADLLSMLVEHEVPFAEGLTLAADATGDPQMQQSARALAERVQRGEAWNAGGEGGDGFPPFLRWLIARGHQQGGLARSLRLAADRYRRRAIEQTEWFKLAFPIVAAVGIGGTVTLLYAFALFLPFTRLLRDMAVQEMPL